MRVVIQRVQNASVSIENKLFSSIEKGLLILVGIEEADSTEDIDWLCRKIIDLRIFADSESKMNLSVKDIEGDILVISQFTLYASTKKGNRPSYIRSAKPEIAIPLYENFISTLSNLYQNPIKTGVFGADMQVSLVNDGPVTICIDSKNKE
jgi:D-tyrosyl-tRNA(Tyr) deacylase